MRKAISVGVAALVAALLGSAVSDGRLTPGNGSTLNLYVEKTGLLSGKQHHFTFERFEGLVDVTERRVTLTIESASIVCRDTWVSEKDRQKILNTATGEMLSAAKYPSIRFESNGVTASESGRFAVQGNLTIRDQSRPVTVSVQQHDQTYTGETRFKLTDFGLKPPSAAFGLVGTKDEMKLTFKLVAR